MKSSIAYIILYSIWLTICQCFQFISPTVVCSNCTINTLTQYTVTLFRDSDSTLATTAWSTQPVPAGANISILFPVQFVLTGSQTCTQININYNPILGFSTVVNITARTLTIIDAIPSATAIANVQITIGNVVNPSPALMTGSFIGRIGNDVSASDVSGSVTLYPGTFRSLTVTFDPTTVNTTSNMIITAMLGNTVPANGSIVVLFPGRTWARQISSTNNLPIVPTMSCSAISNMSYALSCVGSIIDTTVSVTLSNAFASRLNAGTAIKFSINNIFSPPTTEQVDSITVKTYNSSYQIDSTVGKITGLTPKQLSLSIITPASFTINTNVVIQFDFTLVDTISRTNYIVIVFPAGSIVRYQNFGTSQLSLTNITYSNITNQLTMYQTTNSSNRNIGTAISIRIQSYTTPSSVRTTPPFYLYIMNNAGFKMAGSATINILPKAYTAAVTTANTTINALTSYAITFNLADQLSTSGYFIINIPSQLTPSGSISVQLNGSSINSIPTVQYINMSSIKLHNLNNSGSNIAVQNITITIYGIIQPSSVKNISNFVILIYFSNANDVVAQATTSSTIRTTTGTISNVVVFTSSNVTAASAVTYSFAIQLANPLNNGSKITITIPSQVGIISGGVCMQSVVVATGCVVNSTSVTITLNSAFAASTIVNISYSLFTNPPSTSPTSTFRVNTFNSVNQAVDVLGNIIVAVTMTIPSQLTAVTLTRGSRQNSLSTIYTFMFTQMQAINVASAAISFNIPSSISFNSSSIVCSSGSTTLSCSVTSPNTITIIFTPIQTDKIIYNFTIQNLINPSSYRSTSSITILTSTSDLLFDYSTITTGLSVINQIPSNFISLNYTFTNQFLQDNTNLIINVTNTDIVGYFIVQFAASYRVNATSMISCNADTFIPFCTLQFNNITNLHQIKVKSTGTIPLVSSVTFSGLVNPSTIPSDFTWITTYTADNFLISQSRNLIQFSTFCTFPCRQCLTTNRTVCTSCYSTNLTNRIYLFQQQCVATCPIGYIVDNVNYVCQACTLPCYQCLGAINYCTSCVSNSTFKYINRTSTTSTCLTNCPVFMYPDLTQIPNICVNCVSPCSQCSNVTTCLSCVSSYLLYGSQCLEICPALTTVQINSTCFNCSSTCATCANAVDNCTSCPDSRSLYNGICYTSCPGDLISINFICVACDISCKTCSVIVTNCTSCLLTSQYPYYYNNMCLRLCPNFYYYDTFGNCLSCNSLGIGCKNCSTPTICLSCDPGFVLLNSQCLSTVPNGYLNISGIAVPCQGQCSTCVGILTNCTSCRTLNLLNNTCTSTCPTGTIALSRQCQTCAFPCAQCINTTSICTRCLQESQLYFSNNLCINGSACPTFTYPDNSTMSCVACLSPCSQCLSATICITCRNGYFYVNSTSTCELTCPPRSVGINRVCQACTSPCLQCNISTTRCLSCIQVFYYNPNTFQCSSTCPTGQIANQTTMRCMNCIYPCKTCINTTDTCLSCINGTYLSNNLCVILCPAGQYGSSGLCKDCENNCTTCLSAVTCLSCTTPLLLYSSKCLQQCPDAFAIVSTDNVCTSCTTVVPNCSNCTLSGQCYSCYFPSIYYNQTCWSQCPTNYTYINFTCVFQNSTDIVLTETLSSYTFPIPFTILGCVLFIACSMSKLQSHHSYLIGLLYTMFGLIETGCLAYLVYSYLILQASAFVLNNLYILYAVGGGIYILNILCFIIQTPFLLSDSKFNQWYKSNNKSFFILTTIVSLSLNYKFKMILFTKLFRFNATNASLQNVYRFRVFNVFSFFGILIQALALYVSILQLIKFTFANAIFQAFLDVVIIYCINILLAILIVWKPDSFFYQETQQGYAINKKFNINGDDYSKQAMIDNQIVDQGHMHGPDSYNMPVQTPLLELNQSSQQLSQKLTQNQLTIHKSLQVSTGRKLKVYFANCDQQNNAENDDSSNPFRKFQKDNKIEQIHPQNSQRQNNQYKIHNIFSDVSGADQLYSHHQIIQLSQNQESEIGGSQNLQARLSPRSPRKHATIVITAPERIKTNAATENDDIHNKISIRAKQLEELKKQLDEQQKIRKEQRKSRKKLKKTIEVDYFDALQVQQNHLKQKNVQQQQHVHQQQNLQQQQHKQPSQASYQQISIKDSSQKQQTQYDSNPKTIQQIQKNIKNKVLLDEEAKLENVEQDFKEKPKDTIGNWMEMRITQQNRKLPIFSARTNGQLATISLPQSQPVNQNDFEQQTLPNNEFNQNLQQQQKQDETQIKQIKQKIKEKQKLNQQLRNNNKTISANFELQKSIPDQDKVTRKNIKNIYEQVLQQQRKQFIQQQKQYQQLNKDIQFQDKHSRQLQDSSRVTQQITIKNKKTYQPYEFQQENNQYDQRAGTRLNLQNIEHQNQLNGSLEDSQHQDNQKINQRPYSAHRKNNNFQQNQALLQILAKAQQEKLASKNHKIKKNQPRDTYQRKDFKYSGGPVISGQHQIIEQNEKDQEIYNKTSMYMVGLNQFQKQDEDRLNRKKTMNYPLNTKKSLQDSEQNNSYSQLQQSRNRSFNPVPFRKFASKDISAENIDELGLQYSDYKKNYEQLMNQRGMDRLGTSGTARTNMSQKISSNFRNIRRANMRERGQDIIGQDTSLENYYRRQKIKSYDKRDKNKSHSRQKSFQQTKRIKELQKIYLSKK